MSGTTFLDLHAHLLEHIIQNLEFPEFARAQLRILCKKAKFALPNRNDSADTLARAVHLAMKDICENGDGFLVIFWHPHGRFERILSIEKTNHGNWLMKGVPLIEFDNHSCLCLLLTDFTDRHMKLHEIKICYHIEKVVSFKEVMRTY